MCCIYTSECSQRMKHLPQVELLSMTIVLSNLKGIVTQSDQKCMIKNKYLNNHTILLCSKPSDSPLPPVQPTIKSRQYQDLGDRAWDEGWGRGFNKRPTAVIHRDYRTPSPIQTHICSTDLTSRHHKKSKDKQYAATSC